MSTSQSSVESSKSAEAVLREALETILASSGGRCESFTTGIGSCFRYGQSLTARDGTDRVCNSCIADAGLKKASTISTATDSQ